MHILYKEFSDSHEIMVYETEELEDERGHFRVLQFSNEAIQGAIDLNRPERIVLEYPRAIIHLMEFNNPSFENVFVIGHGIGTIAKHYESKRVTVAEIDEKVVELSRQYFGYGKDNVKIGDGRQILEQEKPQTYEYIVLDAFTDRGTPLHLTSGEFFAMADEKLDSRGALIMNLMGKGAKDKSIDAVRLTLGEQFTYVRSFFLPTEGSRDLQNIIMIGSHRPVGFRARNMAGFTEY